MTLSGDLCLRRYTCAWTHTYTCQVTLFGDLVSRIEKLIDEDNETKQLLGEAAGGQGMVGGQALDISGSLKGLEQVRAMQKLKTGALIAASAVGPAIIYGEGTDFQQRLSRFGHLIGALFQVTDDLLDLDQDDQDDGKNLAQHLTLTEVKTLKTRSRPMRARVWPNSFRKQA